MDNSKKHWLRVQEKKKKEKEREGRDAWNMYKQQAKLATDAFNEMMTILKSSKGV